MTHAERQAAAMWQDVMPMSGILENRMIECVNALEKRGYDVSEARQLIPAGWEAYNSGDYWALQKVAAMIWEALRRAPKMVNDDHKPDTWDELRMSWTRVERPMIYDLDEGNRAYRDKVYGAWYGKCIGCALGDPSAGWPSAKVRAERGWVGDYLREPDARNDDINYQIIVLHCIENGPGFTSRTLDTVGNIWA